MATDILMSNEKASSAKAVAAAPAISSARLSKSFGGLHALRDVTFQIAPGEILGILGPNGAGKTTFINVLSGMLHADSGTVHIYDDDVSAMSMAHRARYGLFRTFQNSRPSEELTGYELLRLASLTPNKTEPSKTYTPDELLDLFGLRRFAGIVLSDLPYGIQKMMNLAAVALCRPKVLLLDEPFQGVAEAEIERLSTVIRHFASEGVAVGLVEHNVRSVMRLCNRVIVLDAGAMIFEGRGEDAVRDPVVQTAYLGQRFAGELNG